MSQHMYTHQKVKKWRLLSATLRGLGMLFRYWPLVVITGLLILPYSPQLRVTYQYHDLAGKRYYFNCQYFGIEGSSFPKLLQGCPLILIIDRRDGSVVNLNLLN